MPELEIYLQHDLRLPDCFYCLRDIGKITGFEVKIRNHRNTFWECYRADREQFDAACILERFVPPAPGKKTIIVTDVDLFLPIFTFVFGLAQLGGDKGIVSIHRLRNEHYGLPENNHLLAMRMKKEIIHEFGHLIGMRHCYDHNCVMASANNIDDLDVKADHFCPSCREILT